MDNICNSATGAKAFLIVVVNQCFVLVQLYCSVVGIMLYYNHLKGNRGCAHSPRV